MRSSRLISCLSHHSGQWILKNDLAYSKMYFQVYFTLHQCYPLSQSHPGSNVISNIWVVRFFNFSKYALGVIDPYCMCLSDYSAYFHICVENRLEPNSAFMNYETNEADVKKDAKFFGYETRACLLVLILIFILLMCAARGVEDKNMSDQSPDGESSKKSHYPYKGHAWCISGLRVSGERIIKVTQHEVTVSSDWCQ